MDPVVVKAWLDIAEEVLGLVLLAVIIFGLIKFVDYIIKHPD